MMRPRSSTSTTGRLLRSAQGSISSRLPRRLDGDPYLVVRGDEVRVHFGHDVVALHAEYLGERHVQDSGAIRPPLLDLDVAGAGGHLPLRRLAMDADDNADDHALRRAYLLALPNLVHSLRFHVLPHSPFSPPWPDLVQEPDALLGVVEHLPRRVAGRLRRPRPPARPASTP